MASFGEELRRERELRDISLKEISEATNISIRLLEALERNEFSGLPGGAYTRGFIRSYARHVGLNVEETLDRYSQELARREAAAVQDGAARTRPVVATPRLGPPIPAEPRAARVGIVVISAFLLGSAVIGGVYWLGLPSRAAPQAPGVSPHVTALKARVKKSGALPSLSEDPFAEPAAPTSPAAGTPPAMAEPESAAAGPEIAPPVEHLIRIRALETTRIQLTCAGGIVFREEMWVGSERHFPCREPILLSAVNAGAVEYAVDNLPRRILGLAGEVVRDRAISVVPDPPPGAGEAAGEKPPPPGGATPHARRVDQAAGTIP